ncbi:type IV pilin protein [Burkholderia gladioli]|uniref:type IV pilin protein n=1 Tax=Burkholderia gladioli TaxID=28095 RepID=UPI0009E39BAE|nr:type IV pilin protein [Burkholderia gladioli]MDA0570870.1 prepilin-type N-terminal cleavage/methylation domain-containing protein [Burkholderia gladioli]MDA0598856.1 prepilin-type N-terminal cleavage/methylation domain-containing protein [Burkholderia gladioli]
MQAPKHPASRPGTIERLSPGRAFTLIELMIALAVAALIAAFAVPSYRRQIDRGHRLGAVTALYRVAQDLAERGGFETTGQGEGMELGTVPEQGPPVYRLSAEPAPAGGYWLSATPVPNGPMRDDSCGTYLLRADGLRGNRPPGASGPGVPRPECWTMR